MSKMLTPIDRYALDSLEGITWLTEPVDNVFCKTGQGGGIDPTCPVSGSGSSGTSSIMSKVKGGTDAERADIEAVTSRIPEAARKAAAEHLRDINIYPDRKSFNEGTWKNTEENFLKNMNVKPGEPVSDSVKKFLAEKRDVYVKTANIEGGYNQGTLDMSLNSSGRYPLKYTYAHEIGHAIDKSRGAEPHSKSSEFGKAFALEIFLPGKDGKPRLTEYAATQHKEGFAEFARLIYSGDHDLKKVAKQFPMTTKYFQENGLWPEPVKSPKDPKPTKSNKAKNPKYK